MFGTFRFALAIMVVLTHIAGIEVISGIAVWAFFMLSGYLMTAILTRKYGYTAFGLKTFAISRFIRLYPLYWFSILLCIIFIICFEHQFSARFINAQLTMPVSFHEWTSTVLIFGTTILGLGRPESALSPSVWAVDVELIMYVCSAIFLSRSFKISFRTFLVLVVLFPVLWYVAKIVITKGETEIGNQLIYSFLLAALIPYSLGCLLFFKQQSLSLYLEKIRIIPWIIVCSLLIILDVVVISKLSITLAYLLPVPLMAITILLLADVKTTSSRARQLDNYLGDLSYPVYLLHWLGAYITALIFSYFDSLYLLGKMDQHEIFRFNWLGFASVMIVILVICILSVKFVEHPIESFRTKFKTKQLARISPN